MSDLALTVIVPVYNEARMLASSTEQLVRSLRARGQSFELLLAENGSTDKTREIASNLAASLPEVRVLSIDEPNYGRALRAGIAAAQGEFVICEEIDLCDEDFHQRALMVLQAGRADLVIGSKLLAKARDDRPLSRHLASHVYTSILRFGFGYRGTDTHGLKAFRREELAPVAARCVVDRDVFASELVLRAQREGLRIVEIPVALTEKRPPSIQLMRRVPSVLRRLIRLKKALAGPKNPLKR